METFATAVFFVLMFLLLWVLPFLLGMRAAERKNRSAQWMWFCIHPVTGWITAAVLMSLPPLKMCPSCMETVKLHARVCPYCMREYETLVCD
jgi:hypothetical protein